MTVPRASGVWVAVDPGAVRVGVAACDTGEVLASPVATLGSRDSVTGVIAVVTERDAIGVVVGFPLSMSGAEGTAAAKARSYAEALTNKLSVPVYLVDERLTTVAASTALRAGGHDSRSARRVVDQAAATALLQGILDARAARGISCATLLEGGMGQKVSPARFEDLDAHEGDRL